MNGKRSLHTIKHELYIDLLNAINIFRITITTLNKKSWKDVSDRLNLLRKTCKNMQWLLMVIDVKLCGEPPVKHKKTPAKIFPKFTFLTN